VKAAALALAAGSLVLAGCGGGGSSAPSTTTAAPHGTTVSATEPRYRVIPIAINGGKPVGGITRVTVDKGERVDLIVHSDVADEVHLHGYDLHKNVKAGGIAEIVFHAKISGVFEAELEQRKLQILELTVK